LQRGYSRQDLNISFLKEQQLKLGDTVSKVVHWPVDVLKNVFHNNGAASAPDAKRRKEKETDDNGQEHEQEAAATK
jgi:hypothetical protein